MASDGEGKGGREDNKKNAFGGGLVMEGLTSRKEKRKLLGFDSREMSQEKSLTPEDLLVCDENGEDGDEDDNLYFGLYSRRFENQEDECDWGNYQDKVAKKQIPAAMSESAGVLNSPASSKTAIPRSKISALAQSTTALDNRRKINLRMMHSHAKKLRLANMHALPHEIPVHEILSGGLTETLLKLDLSGNRLSHIDPRLVQSWKRLKTLDFSQCELVDLPSDWNIPTLKRLILAHNKLEHFPSQDILKGLPELQGLDMHDNKVSEIVLPQSDENLLCKLDTLRLGYNHLTELPLSLTQIQSLRVLRVPHNKLTKIPQNICNMPRLRELEASGNPLVQPPLEICERGIDVMRRFYASLEIELQQVFLKKEKIAINTTLKVMFVGMAMSGKTSIIKRLIKGRNAKIPKSNERTVGVKTHDWDPNKIIQSEKEVETKKTSVPIIDTQIQLEDETLKMNSNDIDLDVKFSVWDFAGQHVYHATHELFFSPRALYVLVWDMGAKNEKTYPADDTSSDSDDDDDDKFSPIRSTNSCENDTMRANRELEKDIDEKVQFWIDSIQTSAPGAAILPVASHADSFVSLYGDSFDDEEAERRCKIMKERLLEHERKRREGLQERLDKYREDKLADTGVADRLRDLLSSRPKLLFDTDKDQSVAKVSSKFYKGFDDLRRKIVHIASGRERGSFDRPIFRGHVGTRIPRIYLEVRNVVRSLRSKEIHVVEWDEFLLALKKEKGVDNVEDVGDALHFLANVGELCYFGDTVKNKVSLGESPKKKTPQCFSFEESDGSLLLQSGNLLMQPGETEDIFQESPLYTEKKSSSPFLTIKKSVVSKDTAGVHSLPGGLSQFIFLNPRWLVASVACILDHGLSKKLYLARQRLKKQKATKWRNRSRFSESFCETKENCPVITAEDAHMLWEEENYTKVATEDATDQSNKISFDFLQSLLVRFGVFVPINLNIELASLGGKNFTIKETKDETPRFFFLPCLLGPHDSEGEPRDEVWTYKTEDAYKTTICNSILFPDVVPPGLMERVTSAVLNDIFSATQRSQKSDGFEDEFQVVKLLCWQSAFFIKVKLGENITEIFCHLVGEASEQCVASQMMGAGMTRLLLSGKGQAAADGQKIWDVGFCLVDEAVERVLNEYGGLEFEEQCICPKCLERRPKKEARVWDWTEVDLADSRGDETLICQFGHRVKTALVNGYSKQSVGSDNHFEPIYDKPDVLVRDLFRSVVLVGLFDGRTRKITRVGSGFVVNKNDGLIVTAAHTVINIRGRPRSSFGEDYYGLPDGRIVVGVIPQSKEGKCENFAVFRYFAKIVAKDENMSDGVCNLDACVLRITTRLVKDVLGNGHKSFDQPEITLTPPIKGEKLQKLRTTENFEHEEYARIIGFNQSGEGVLEIESGDIDRCVDFARGFVVKDFKSDDEALMRHKRMSSSGNSDSSLFKPRAEIVVMCQDSSTIGGHSGGPCVNDQGEVIGILSRRDELDRRRCYVVPTSDWMHLVKKAKKMPVSRF